MYTTLVVVMSDSSAGLAVGFALDGGAFVDFAFL